MPASDLRRWPLNEGLSIFELTHIATLAIAGTGNSLTTTLLIIVAVLFVVVTLDAYLILAERKISAYIQDRVGPDRAGPRGLLQPLADVVKLLLKEDFTPRLADRWLYRLAPIWIIVPALIGLAVVPLGGEIVIGQTRVRLQIAAVDVGLLYVAAVASLGVYGVVLGGWSSNSKYSFLGALRSAAQLLSYEVPLALMLLIIALTAGSLRLETILARQAGAWWGWLPHWNLFTQPLAFVIFLAGALAESNRLPFDLPEAEQELVGGYHTEYSSMKFGLFFLAEYSHLLTSAAVATVLFLGGWSLGGLLDERTEWYFGLLRVGVFLAKIAVLIFVVMQIRWTLPRFRFDQLMSLAWRGLIPGALTLLVLDAIVLWSGAAAYWFTLANVATFVLMVVMTGLIRQPITGRERTRRQSPA